MKLSGVTFQGPELTNAPILSELSIEYFELLRERNGFIAFEGGFHLRGVCDVPVWHSLAEAWRGENSLHRLFPSVRETDVPFGEDCMGDQFLLRESEIYRLSGESGDAESLKCSWRQFFERLTADSFELLRLHPLVQFQRDGGRLEPGQLLSVYPPFVCEESRNGVSLSAIPATERISFLADFARQFASIADGEQCRITVSNERNGR
jgi:hypothetical protein